MSPYIYMSNGNLRNERILVLLVSIRIKIIIKYIVCVTWSRNIFTQTTLNIEYFFFVIT